MNFLQRLRQCHSLEHATIHLLHPHLKGGRLVGWALPWGFYLLGKVDKGTVMKASEEALKRLKGGERGLAISPSCGTNLVVAGGAAALAAFLVLRGRGWRRFPKAVGWATLAFTAARPLGPAAQKYLTTSPDLEEAYIEEVSQKDKGSLILVKVGFRTPVSH